MAKTDNITGYDLSRAWFDFAFENQGRVKPNHTALYFFCIEHWNRMGWVKSFGLPTEMAKSAIGISSYNTYINTLTDLIEWGFIIMVQKSQNQYSSNIVALSKNDKPRDKSLDKALIKHGTKHTTNQSESTVQSIDSINKQYNNITIEPITIEQEKGLAFFEDDLEEKNISDLSLKILHDFNFTETKNFNKLIKIAEFLRVLKASGRLEYFTEQYKSYWPYKKMSGAATQSLETFISDGWDRENWSQKLIEHQKQNGKSTNREERQQSVDDLDAAADRILAGYQA
ncbi:MAG: hypothetical protein K0S09_46 [Sphingobacteriaceae bacterium]|nr:hypothetical protein [Sphingobacteriaceae bacterium]